MRRLQFGWFALDRSGRVLDSDSQAELVLATSGVLGRNSAGRLCVGAKTVETEMLTAIKAVADNPQGRSRALTLSRHPLLDMLITPARKRSISSKPAAVIAFVHGDSWGAADRHEQLAELFALTPGEARLALALCRGLTITEAAEDFGLTTHTVRTYSKAIYAKTGARGLPDLVRLVMRSVLAIAPDA